MEKDHLFGARALAEHAHKRLPEVVERIRFQRTSRGLNHCYEALAICHRELALSDYFVDGNLHSFKQHLHVASQLDHAAIALYDHERFSTVRELLYAVLSDSRLVIDAMATLASPYFVSACGNPLNSQFLIHMYQLAIRGDYTALQSKVERLSKNGRKKDRLLSAQGRDFFSLLIRGDRMGLEDLIVQDTLVKSGDPWIENLMCTMGTLQAKICWLKGIQVQVDSPLLPMALMPIEPLAHYDDVYDFLKPDYVPPKVGLFERLSYWYKERAQRREGIQRAIEASRPKPP